MTTDFRIFRDVTHIFTHWLLIWFHLNFSIKNDIFNLSKKCHPSGSLTSQNVHNQQGGFRRHHIHRNISGVISFHFIIPFDALLYTNVAITVLCVDIDLFKKVMNSLLFEIHRHLHLYLPRYLIYPCMRHLVSIVMVALLQCSALINQC